MTKARDLADGTFSGDVTVSGNITSTGIDDNATSTAMTLDSSGNLLVGKSSQNQAVEGFEYSGASKYMYLTKGGRVSAYFDRLTSDGDIVEFRKAGSTVGSIGTNGGDLFISNSDTGLRYRGVEDNIIPCDGSGGSRDNAVDLGGSPYRFKDLYLSGGVYVGGTGSANKLDDYEEGTWTPTVSSGSATVNKATYTKIGNLVTIYADLRSFSERSSTDSVRINGLPFTAAKRSVGAVMYRYMSDIPTNGSIVAYVDSVNYVHFLSNGGIGNWRGTQYADLDSASSILAFTITYQI